MAVDYEALNQQVQALAKKNTNVIGPGSIETPQARQESLQVGRGTLTGTPYEIEQIQKAMSGGVFSLGGVLSSGSSSGFPTNYGVGDNGSFQITTGQSAGTRGYSPSGLSTKEYSVNTESAQQRDIVTQMLENAGISNASGLVDKYGRSPEKLALLEAAVRDYMTQQQSFEQQAENYAAGTGIMSEGVTSMGQELDSIAMEIRGNMGQGLSDQWQVALDKADEYVSKADERTREVLGELNGIIDEMNNDLRFEKAHDMQVSVQASLGQMASEEKAIASRYGVDSPEMQQFTASKKNTLAQVQSSVHATYGNLRTQFNETVMGTYAQTATNMSMYQNYQEQSALNVYKAAAEADQLNSMQWTQQLIGIEQLKLQGQTMLAEWVANTPVFSASLSSLLSIL